MVITLNTALILFTLTILGFATKAIFTVANEAKNLGIQQANHANFIVNNNVRIQDLEDTVNSQGRRIRHLEGFVSKYSEFIPKED
jgi:hypothetical protein